MAKINANGAHKVAQSSRREVTDTHYRITTYVLTSDGRILHKLTLRRREDWSTSRGPYAVAAKLKSRDGTTPDAHWLFKLYVARRGHDPDAVQFFA